MGNTKGKAPKTYSVRVSENALQNHNDIVGFIAFVKRQPINAVRVGDKIMETIERIERNPLSFCECEEIPTLSKIYRKAVCMSWLVIYKIIASKIIILGIIHSSRRPSSVRKLRKVR